MIEGELINEKEEESAYQKRYKGKPHVARLSDECSRLLRELRLSKRESYEETIMRLIKNNTQLVSKDEVENEIR